jgi:hypothetical protein
MQLTFSCTPSALKNIEGTISPARLGRYAGSAGVDKQKALQLYVWNARLCEAFYLPIQLCEVAIRNAIHGALENKHGDNWYERGSFLCTLPKRLREELDGVIKDERSVYGAGMTLNHIVSGLSLGFWLHLLTKNYEGVLWPNSFATTFPNKPGHIDRDSLYNMVNSLRIHRNRIAHHKPVFDRQPTAELQNLMTLIKWVCDDTFWFTKTISTVQQTINQRP